MKMVNSLILGSAAGLIAMSGAQAADLPVKAKAVEYVRICSLYGAGFYYIPGTDTCIKLGGYLRADVAVNTQSDFNGQYNGVGGGHNRLNNYFTTRARETLDIDTRTATEYGVVRTFANLNFSWTTGQFTNNGTTPGTTSYSGAAPVGNPSDGGIGGGSVGIYHAFIQFAGFTIGRTLSQFDAPWVNYPGNNFDGLVGGSGTVTGVNQLTYTAQFGNGVSAAVSAVDPTNYYQAGVLNLTGASAAGMLGGANGANNIAGTRTPNLEGMVRVDQAWGLFQLSLAAHENIPGYYGASEPTGHPSNKWGFAVQGALSIKNIPTGPGDVLNLQAVYTDGATRYNLSSLAAVNYGMYSGTNLPGAYQSIGFANAPDVVYTGTSTANGTGLESVTSWGFRGAFTHNWDPYWNSAVYGAYAGVRYGNLGKTVICANATVLLGLAGTCNPDFNIVQAGIITRWTPVKNLTFSADFAWTRLDQKYAGTVVSPLIAGPAKPAAVYELRDQDSFNFLVRAQRNW